MMGFDPVSLFTAGYLLAASSGCPAPEKPPDIDVVFTQNAPVYVTNLTSAQLRQKTEEFDQQAKKGTDMAARATAENRAETLQVMHQSGEIFTGGSMAGDFKVQYNVGIKSKWASFGESSVCLYPDKVKMELIYSPTIYVAAEYETRSCAKVVVTGHEKNHVARDLLAISVYMPRAKEALTAYLAQLGGQGPYPNDEAQLSAASQAISRKISAAMEAKVFDPLALLRQQYQSLLDNPANYTRESSLCPSWQWKITNKE